MALAHTGDRDSLKAEAERERKRQRKTFVEEEKPLGLNGRRRVVSFLNFQVIASKNIHNNFFFY